MALIECPECGKQVSSAAPSCPKCGYPIAQKVGKALRDDGPVLRDPEPETPEPQETPAATVHDPRPRQSKPLVPSRVRVMLFVAVVLVLWMIGFFDQGERNKPTGPVAPQQQSAVVHEVPRDESRAFCRDVVRGLAPKLRDVLGVPTVAVQASMSDTMFCNSIPEGFSCKDNSPLELRLFGRNKLRGFRFMFTEEPVDGFAAPGCCEGVAEAAEVHHRAEFLRYGAKNCSLTFGRFPP